MHGEATEPRQGCGQNRPETAHKKTHGEYFACMILSMSINASSFMPILILSILSLLEFSYYCLIFSCSCSEVPVIDCSDLTSSSNRL